MLRVAACLENLAPYITPLEPSETSESDWTIKFVVPYSRLLLGPKLEVKFDCRTDSRPQRPDLRIYVNKGRHTRCVLWCEAKTKWAKAAEVKEEVARVIERTMDAFRDEVSFFHTDRSPKLAVSIVDQRGTVYAVFLYLKLFLAVEIGSVTLATSITPETQHVCESAIQSWRGLRALVIRLSQKMAMPATLPSVNRAPSMLPPTL
ncbi:hypothetical protein BDZ88DRAFT_286731 [Geranomyces variabilis]|nr:hypothetical protein BDZ88DRAFT_286731 [Geranomyces variabilis]